MVPHMPSQRSDKNADECAVSAGLLLSSSIDIQCVVELQGSISRNRTLTDVL